jgi:hypothetical protein
MVKKQPACTQKKHCHAKRRYMKPPVLENDIYYSGDCFKNEQNKNRNAHENHGFFYCHSDLVAAHFMVTWIGLITNFCPDK